MNAPMHAPMQFIEPIQEICSLVSGPDNNGESSADNFANAGETHPILLFYTQIPLV